MDLETENRLAALLMEEARRLRAQADKEGVHSYLCKPNVRGRPNSRFLTATVLGVEQANRAVEVSELWRAREKELELDAKIKSREKDKNIRNGEKRHRGDSHHTKNSQRGQEQDIRSGSCSSSNHVCDEDSYHSSDDDGSLKDDEVEEFLRSRAKRGRGAIGSRMDEPGPYPSSTPSNPYADGKHLVNTDTRSKEEWECRILGPEKPSFIKSHEPPRKEIGSAHSSKKKHHSKQKKKRSEKSKSKEERKSKHRHHKSRRRGGSE
ncbi:arginine/serine-rich coiled-coil protein 2-like [Iris pallida]|uniref:Arginine/serine-rich coiled-coil protein 2-like n=1 Tax=Iris pallida TaxID=29817 RepID=A0AAX6FZH7_IRIPA|nr:arginine/serine-rich coiled-coil protein 2-like [Iris pallida]